MTENQHALIISGSSHTELAEAVSKLNGIKLGKVKTTRFPDGEISLKIEENVLSKTIFLFQTVAFEPDKYLFELLLLVDALKRASAKKIIAVIPYFGYSRQDKKESEGVPITAKLISSLLERAGVTHVITFDLHAEQLEGFFDIPLDHLKAKTALLEAFKTKELSSTDNQNLIVVAPDMGRAKFAQSFAKELSSDLAIINKKRLNPLEVEVLAVIGDVNGKDVLLADDMCTTGATLLSAAKACQEKGAKTIRALITHGLFIDDAIEKIEKSPIDALYTTDTIPLNQKLTLSTKIQIVSIAPLLAKAIQRLLS